MNIEILKYDPECVRKNSEIKIIPGATFKNISPEIEHVRSTSVLGLDSKSVIDILLGLNDIKEADQMFPEMKSLDMNMYLNIKPK